MWNTPIYFRTYNHSQSQDKVYSFPFQRPDHPWACNPTIAVSYWVFSVEVVPGYVLQSLKKELNLEQLIQYLN